MLKRRTDAEPNAQKTDGTDGSELQNTLKGMEHGRGAEVRNKVRKKGRYGTYNVGVIDLASAYDMCCALASRNVGVFRFTDRTKVYGITRGFGKAELWHEYGDE